jgi:hypothetical protein
MIHYNRIDKRLKLDEQMEVSEEILGAYVEGGLTNIERKSVEELMESDENISTLINEIQSYISSDDKPEFGVESEDTLPDSLELPHIEFSNVGEVWDVPEDTTNISVEIDKKNEMEENVASSYTNKFNDSLKESITYGADANTNSDTYDENIDQGRQPSCAIRSQEIICRDYGIIISQDELIAYAQKNGWYSPDPQNGGTPRDAVGNILEACGISTTRTENASIYDIISELRAGHRVIVSLDADELWLKKEPNLLNRIFGKITNMLNDKFDEMNGISGANHALIVAGVNVNPNDPSDIHVILTDPGTGDVCKVYELDEFQEAWNDSNRYMVSTNIPAPYQYNYKTGSLEPSNFETDFMPSTVALPEGLHNQFKIPQSYFDDYSDMEATYSWERVIPYWKNVKPEGDLDNEEIIAGYSTNNKEDDMEHRKMSIEEKLIVDDDGQQDDDDDDDENGNDDDGKGNDDGNQKDEDDGYGDENQLQDDNNDLQDDNDESN